MPSRPTRVDDPAGFTALLLGQQVQSIWLQQFWLRSQLVEEACVVNLATELGRWVRFFFDGPCFFWGEGAPTTPAPEPVFDSEGFAYPRVEAQVPGVAADKEVVVTCPPKTGPVEV